MALAARCCCCSCCYPPRRSCWWPFGIVPTVAAALPTVSVESTPTPASRVISLPGGGVAGCGPLPHRIPAALDALTSYLYEWLLNSRGAWRPAIERCSAATADHSYICQILT